MSEAPHLLVSDDDGIMICTLNRPDKLNALSDQTLELFEAALLRFRDAPELKVMLIRATGRYFSAGADLHEGGARGRAKFTTGSSVRESHRLQNRNMHRIYDEMEHIEKPIVVAHHAPCVGGGLELSLSCDFRLAAKSAHYSLPENKMGVIPASNGVSRLTRLCGPHWARWMVMAGQIVDSDDAKIMGLVHKVYPDEIFAEEVMKFCRHLAKQNGEQMGTAKLAIEMCWDVDADQARQVERMANSTLIIGPYFATMSRTHAESLGRKGKEPA